jgi:protein arginine kinase activator
MKCQFPDCSQQATVHVTQISNGQVKEVHLCERHAAETGLLGGHVAPAPAVHSSGGSSRRRRSASEATCDLCGISWSKFQSTGRFGCAHCYDVFREDLMPLVERIHDSDRHRGRVPRHLARTLGLRQEIDARQRELNEAVAREDYERAAHLRDEIKELEKGLAAKKQGSEDEPAEE